MSTAIVENSTMSLPEEIRYDIYMQSFLNHPFLKEASNVRAYFLMQKIAKMCDETGDAYVDMCGLFPDEIAITASYSVGVYHLTFPSKNPKNTGVATAVYIRILTDEEAYSDLEEYVVDNICEFSPASIFHNLAFAKRVKGYLPPADYEPEEPETKFENQHCPVCMSGYTENADEVVEDEVHMGCWGSCGHKICVPCYGRVIASDISRCPECRAEWVCPDDYADGCEIYYTVDDIRDLCDVEDAETLIDLLDIGNFAHFVRQQDGYAHTLGYSDEEFEEGFDIPDKYRQMEDGGESFYVFVEEF
jgi:hypothetical protein